MCCVVSVGGCECGAHSAAPSTGCDDNGYESSIDNDDDLSSDDDTEVNKGESDVSWGLFKLIFSKEIDRAKYNRI